MRFPGLVLLLACLFAGCDSKVTTTVDSALQQRVETFQDCFPGLYSRVEALLDLADTWRQQNTSPIANPTGASAAVGVEAGGTVVNVSYLVDSATIAMAIRFYGPDGTQQTLAVDGGSVDLNTVLHDAASQLRTSFAGSDLPFFVADFDISGGGITATDEAVLGRIGGTSSAPVLSSLSTCATHDTISGGAPAADSITIANAAQSCSITFSTADLQIDQSAGQAYPIGTVELSITDPQTTIVATITFDGTSTLAVTVDDVPGSFTFDVVSRVLTYVE